jgi:hypothetical protein
MIAEDISTYAGEDRPLDFDMTPYGEASLAGWTLTWTAWEYPGGPVALQKSAQTDTPDPGKFRVGLVAADTAPLRRRRRPWQAWRTDVPNAQLVAAGFWDLL